MIDPDLVRRYRAFRNRTGCVGRDALVALSLARAEQRAESIGLRVVAEPEEESYEDVYGEPPYPGASFYWIAIYRPDRPASAPSHRCGEVPLASLGFVDDVDPRYWRETVAHLYSEALDLLDSEVQP